jgi:hypothetical protein
MLLAWLQSFCLAPQRDGRHIDSGGLLNLHFNTIARAEIMGLYKK